jgi:Lrp/AsnC family transcriptional regulator for asnA, asnC and gidA
MRIIELLGQDARVSNRQIAAELGVTEGTIRARIKRLQQENLIRFTVVTDFRLAGSPNLVMLGIHAAPAKVHELAAELSRMREINCVIVLLGRYSLMAMGLFTSLMDVNTLVRTRIMRLPGVRSVETSVSVRNFKYDARLARIVSKPAARGRARPETPPPARAAAKKPTSPRS